MSKTLTISFFENLKYTIQSKISEFFPDYKLESNFQVCPVALQVLAEKNEYAHNQTNLHKKNFGMYADFCQAWSLWYVQARITLPDLTQAELIDRLLKYHKSNPLELTEFIRAYGNWIKNKSDYYKHLSV